MKRMQFITLTSILLFTLILIPATFAVENQTVMASGNETISSDVNEDMLSNHYYFDASLDNDKGDGSMYNPYQKLTPYRVKANSVLHLDDGEYNFNSNAEFNNVTMIGEGSQNTIIKNAVITSSNSLTLYNLTFADSTFKMRNDLTAVNCIFTNSSSTKYGGVIFPEEGKVVEITLDGCTFSGNDAVCGGAIYMNEGVLNIKNSLFINNHAQLFGGAIASLRSSVTFDNVTARNNKAGGDGGVVWSLYGDFKMYNSTLTGNHAENGAGLFIDEADYNIIINNRFIDNVPLIRASLFSFYNSNSTIRDNEYSDSGDLYETSDLDFIGNGNYTLYNSPSIEITDIPSKYDLRQLGYVTPVKNQGNDGNCWAFATLATLESCILKALGESFDLSESNVKNLFGRYSDYGWTLETNKGAYASSGYNHLISWLGPVLEKDDPYIVGTIYSKVFNSLMHVQNVLYLQRNNFTDNDEIKKAIMTYGAVYTPVYANFDGNGHQYYNGEKSANHAIVIVGWDDDMTFSGAPGKGGWIIKNSWGASWRGTGYGYVSYYDVTCAPIGKADSVFTFILNDTMKYDKNYQHDVQGKSDFFLNSSSSVWYKNKFTSTENEYLAAVSTMFDKQANYTFSVYVNGELKLTQSGSTKPGYYTFNLDEIIPLSKGDVFEVVFNITVVGDAGVPIAEKVSFNKYYYKQNISFISYDGVNWADLFDLKWKYTTHSYDSSVACIKAFTYLKKIGTNVKLSLDNIRDTTLDLIAAVYNQWGYAVNHGTVTFNVSGTEHAVSVVNGVAKLCDVMFNVGVNNFTAAFSNSGYEDSLNYTLFDKNPINTTIEFNEIGQHNEVTISACVRDDKGMPVNYGDVTFNIEGMNYTVRITDGMASINHTFANLGENNITAYYNGNYSYCKSNVTKSIFVLLINTEISLTVLSDYNPFNIVAEIVDENGNPVKKGFVVFSVDGQAYLIDVTDGRANFTYSFTKMGINNVSAVYGDNGYIYNSSKTNRSIEVSKINTELEIIVNQNTNNPVEIVVTVKDQFGNAVDVGEVTFNLNGKTVTANVNEGIAIVTHVFSSMGNNSITAYYNDNSNRFNSSNATSSVNVSKIKVEMTLNITDNINITVEFNQTVNGYVNLLIDAKVYKQKVTGEKCIFGLTNLESRINRVTAYLDSSTYECENKSGEFYVYYTSQLTLNDLSVYYGNPFTVVLSDIYNNVPIRNHEVDFIINDHLFTNTTDKNGKVMFYINFIGDYDVKIRFNGDDDYDSCSLSSSVQIKSTIISSYEVKTINSQYEFQLLDGYGNPLNNTNVSVFMNYRTYSLSTDKDGMVQLNINLNPGNNALVITNPVTNEIKTQNIKIMPRICENHDLTMYYGAGKYFKAKFLDDDGNAAKGVTVRFTFNGKTYIKTTDSKGYASLKISANPLKSTVTAEYKGFRISNNIIIKSTIITKNINVKKGKTIKFTAKLLNKNGKILKYKKITFKFKGKTYKVKTNKYGKATLKITKKYKKGKYTITSSYGKLKIKNTIRIR